MHAGTVPIEGLLVGAQDRFAVILDIDLVFFAETLQQVTGDPDVVGGLLGALAEDLELPLALGDLGIDAFVVDAGIQAEIEVFLDDLAGDVTDIRVAHARVVGALGGGIATLGEPERTTVLEKEVFLLETEPGVRVVEDRGAGVGNVGSAVGVVDFAHDEHAVLARGIEIHGDGLQHAVGTAAGRLLGGTSVEAPEGKFFELRKAGEVLDLGLAAEAGNGLVAVEPDVFQFVFGHDL